MKQQTKTLIIWVVLATTVIWVSWVFAGRTQVQDVTSSRFMARVHNNWDEFKGADLKFVEDGNNTLLATYEIDGQLYQARVIKSEELTKALEAVEYDIAEKDDGSVLQLMVMYLPMILIVVIMIMFMRQMQAGGGKAMSFGKSKARLLSEHQTKITFKDVAGIEEARDEVEEIIDFLRDTRKYLRVGGRIPKGVLLMGPPGTGKTLLARAIAGEAGVSFFSISGSDFVEMFVGVGASRVRDLFEQGKKNAPCIIFIDEIDAVGRHRGAGLGGGHDEREQTLNQLLVEMDGFESNDGVILVAATNRPDVLDPALLRPGRFDRRIVVSLPDVRGREAILDVHTRRVPLSDDIELGTIARGTPGFSGADLENLVNEAALLAARHEHERVGMVDFEAAKDKVMMGAERRSVHISDEEKRTTAWHEAGHTMVASLLPVGTIDPIHKVTIIPRGRALGVTHLLPDQDRLSLDRDNAEGTICMLMGGRIAEEIAFDGRKTTGAGDDISKASNIARKMICEWGMSDALGPITFGQAESEPFMGRDVGRKQNYSEDIARQIDVEVHRVITEQYNRAKKLLLDNHSTLERLANDLVVREALSAEEVKMIIKGEKLPPVQKRLLPPRISTTPSPEQTASDNADTRSSGAEPEPSA